jgi:cytochrome c553
MCRQEHRERQGARREGGGGRTSPAACHGDTLRVWATPKLAGVHPVYIARQLYLFKDGTRNGGTRN